jgi:hypothetical protein
MAGTNTSEPIRQPDIDITTKNPNILSGGNIDMNKAEKPIIIAIALITIPLPLVVMVSQTASL